MTSLSDIQGVKDLRPRTPIGASLQISIRKNLEPRGMPDQKDRFHILTPREIDGVKRPHPAFGLFNNAPITHRQSIRGVMVHASASECFETSLALQTYPKGHTGERSHPTDAPVCKGNGVQAIRWDGQKYNDIPCPGKLCEYSNMPNGCTIRAQFIFSLRWAPGSPFERLQTPMVKYATKGWESSSAILGFLEFVSHSAKSLGVTDYSLFGLPFTMTLQKRTNKKLKTKYYVVEITTDMDVFQFLSDQREKINLLQSQPRHETLQSPALTDDRVVYEDFNSIGP